MRISSCLSAGQAKHFSVAVANAEQRSLSAAPLVLTRKNKYTQRARREVHGHSGCWIGENVLLFAFDGETVAFASLLVSLGRIKNN